MARGRKPKPTSLKVLEGNPGRRPIHQLSCPVPGRVPTPPSHLDKYAREEWARLAPGLHGLGLLRETDRAVFAAYCQAYSRWRTAEEALQEAAELKTGGARSAYISRTTRGTVAKHPLVQISETAAAAMVKYASEFGLTPSASARLSLPPGGAGGKFAGLLGGKSDDDEE